MPRQLSVSDIVDIGKICQYLSSDDLANQAFLRGGSLDPKLATKIYMERQAVQKLFELDPTNSTLRSTANYLFALLGKYQIQAQEVQVEQAYAAPVVTGPSNASVNVNANASFTVAVTSPLPYVLAWYRNGVLIPGEAGLTYTLTSAQLAESGATFSAIATSASGTGNSSVATLTVNAALSGQYYYGAIGYYTELSGGTDNVPYIDSFPITNGQPLSVPWPVAASNNQNQVIRYPLSQGVKTSFFNTVSNQGSIPGAEYWSILTIGSNLYIVSRNEISLDATSPTTTYS